MRINEILKDIETVLKQKNPKRIEMIDLILTYAGDELETKNDFIKLAKMTDSELIENLSNISEFYKEVAAS